MPLHAPSRNVRARVAEMGITDPMELTRAYVFAHLERLGIIGMWDAADVKRAKAASVAGKPLDDMTPIELTTLAGELSGRAR